MKNRPTTPELPSRDSHADLARVRSLHRRAFSLVEVVLALGIVALAFLGIFSMLPTGLGIFRQAMDTSIGAQIAQRIVSEAQQTDFDALVPGNGSSTDEQTKRGGDGDQFYAMALRYFDDQGTEVLTTNPADLHIVYTARVRGSMPGKADPSAHTSQYFTSLPSSSANRFNPRAVTFLTIQILKNASRQDLTPVIDKGGTFLIDPVLAAKRNLTAQTYTAVVARNGYHKRQP